MTRTIPRLAVSIETLYSLSFSIALTPYDLRYLSSSPGIYCKTRFQLCDCEIGTLYRVSDHLVVIEL